MFAQKLSICFALLGLLFQICQGQKPVCDGRYAPGSCVCHLADGSGTLDLTRLAEETKEKPLETENAFNTNYYYFSFCNFVTNTSQSNCDGKASV